MISLLWVNVIKSISLLVCNFCTTWSFFRLSTAVPAPSGHQNKSFLFPSEAVLLSHSCARHLPESQGGINGNVKRGNINGFRRETETNL